MTTVRLQNSVFIHIPKTGGTSVTVALGEAGNIKYDYRFDCDPTGLKYDDHCKLFKGKDYLQHPPNSMPHAKIIHLRPEDKVLPKFIILRDPFAWYRSYWLHHMRHRWTTEINPPYLGNGGGYSFGAWMKNMVDDSNRVGIGYYSRYIKDWIDDKTAVVRLDHLHCDLKATLENFGESIDCLKYLGRKNVNNESSSLVIPLNIVDRIRELDAEVFNRLGL